MKKNRLTDLFGVDKPIIGMIHLAGKSEREKTKIALEELKIYQNEDVNGAIIEDYHGSLENLYEILGQSSTGLKIIRGINCLRDPYRSFNMARDFGAKFIQFDSVQTPDLDIERYDLLRNKYPEIIVLGGVGFKYTSPTGNPLEQDLNEGKSRCEGIVTTGLGTGLETPLEKLREYKRLLSDFPLIVGAGVNLDNVKKQLQIADGAIIGSYFKQDGNTQLPVDRNKVRELMSIVKDLRKETK